LALLHRNVARQCDPDDYDKQMAFAIWYIEKEFHVGMIDDNFPLMKFYNLYDEYNIEQYNKAQNKQSGTDPNKTFR